MPTENRSSNTEHHDHIEGIIDMVSVPREVIEFAAGLKWHGYKSGTDQKDDQLEALKKLRTILAAPAPQPHTEPIAWMVGTAFWWTKEEAERDAAAIGLPVIAVGPMGDIGLAREMLRRASRRESKWASLCGGRNNQIAELRAKLAEANTAAEQLLQARDLARDQVARKNAQLAERDAQLDSALDDIEGLIGAVRHYNKGHQLHNEEGTLRKYRAALSASAEPSAPAAPYPNRLCHIDYTAHPYRCGCLRGDEESQRIYDEHCRKASAEPEAKS